MNVENGGRDFLGELIRSIWVVDFKHNRDLLSWIVAANDVWMLHIQNTRRAVAILSDIQSSCVGRSVFEAVRGRHEVDQAVGIACPTLERNFLDGLPGVEKISQRAEQIGGIDAGHE